MKTAALIVCFLMTPALAHGGSALPDSCKGRCAAEFKLMEDFSVLTKTSDIERVFGPGRILQTSAGYQIDLHQREQAAFLVVRRPGTKSRDAVAVFRNNQPAHHIRIPYLGLTDGDTRRETLADTTFSFLKKNCFGPVVGAERGRLWTPACYFGRPGTFMAYHFLFRESGCRALNPASIDFEDLSCAAESSITPVAVLVTEWRPNINPPGAPRSLLLSLPMLER